MRVLIAEKKNSAWSHADGHSEHMKILLRAGLCASQAIKH